MTEFVDVKNMVRWLNQSGTEQLIARMSEYIEHDYRRWQNFDKTSRISNHTPFGVIELMPTSDSETYAFKYVTCHPSNPGRGFQTVTAFGVLADVHSGYPVFMAEMTLLTALRAAATSAMAARHLARSDSTRMALIGAGSQAEFQAMGLRAAVGIEHLTVWDIDPAAVAKLERNLVPLGFQVDRATSGVEAVRDSDVITTCTADMGAAVVLHSGSVSPGMHVNAIGGDCPGKTELDPAILRRSDVFVEYEPQTRIEGEIQQLEDDFPVTELWQVVQGIKPGRETRNQVTVFDSVGFAIEDFSALRFLRDELSGTSLTAHLDLIAEPDDPKDLFGMVSSLTPVH